MPILSKRTADLHASPIREILAVIDRPGMISFAGGLPAAETFPSFSLDSVENAMLQYGPSEGEMPLREQICGELVQRGFHCKRDQILILSGSQQGIDLVAKLFIDPGTRIALESPTYLAALQVFRFFGATYQTLNFDKPLQSLSNKPALAYVIPTFQNPTGYCYTREERTALAGACDETETPLFEDDPYRDLVFGECDRTPVCARVERASWIYQGSFSKSLAPGLRLGYLVCSPDLMPYLVRLKQAADLHSNRMSQSLVLRALQASDREARIARLVDFYRTRRDAFECSLEEHFADLATWQRPQGGLFFWLKLKQKIDTQALLKVSIANNVAFMPGEPFFPLASESYPSLRLNFSHANSESAARGLETLARLVRQTQPSH
ncbi:MAG: PLP-dependent aminotransferase family protein [Pirellula sp.]